MNKIRRIFDIAKELNISHIEIIDFLSKKDIKVTLMSVISNENYSEILEHFHQEKNQVDRLRKEKARLNVIHHNQEQDKLIDEQEVKVEKNESVENINKKEETKKEIDDKEIDVKLNSEDNDSNSLEKNKDVIIKSNLNIKENKIKKE